MTDTATRNRAVAYLRVSTDKQADHGVSLDAQRRKAELYSELHDLELVDVIVDAGASAKTLDRPGLQRALGMLRSGQADALLIVKLDRLTRSIRDMAELIDTYFGDKARYGAELLSVHDSVDTRTAAGRLVLNVLASVNQWERETVSERTSAAMQHKREMFEYTGGYVRFGFRVSDDGVHLVEDESEQAVLSLARGLRTAGLSLRAVAGELDRQGFRSRTGKAFAPMQIKNMVAA